MSKSIEEKTDITLEARKVKALEKIASNVEAISMFLESIPVVEMDERLQWYLSMFKEAYLDEKIAKSRM